MKKQVMTAIDEDVHNMAKEKGINVSKVLDDSLRKELDLIEVKINTSLQRCEFCGSKGEGRQESADDVQPITNTKHRLRNEDLLTWLYPDERWICNSCLRRKIGKVPIVL